TYPAEPAGAAGAATAASGDQPVTLASQGSQATQAIQPQADPAAVDAVQFTKHPVEDSVYAKSATLRLSVQADSTDGSALTYQWKWSANQDKSGATKVTGLDGSDARAVLTATAPATPGTYYYWVEITAGTATVTSNLATVVVVDRTLETQLMNGDFQRFGGLLDNPWQPGAWGQVPVGVQSRWGTLSPTSDPALTEPYISLGEYLPYWNTTHWSSTWVRKMIEMQNPTIYATNVAGSGLDATGHANENRPASEKDTTNPLPLIAELSGEARSSIYQDIATVPGKVYEWSLDHASEYAQGVMDYPDSLAVIIGPAINTEADYGPQSTKRWTQWTDGALATQGAGTMNGATVSALYPYGTDTDSLFEDVLVKTAVDAGMTGATDDEKVKALKDHSGEVFVTEYNGGKYYVYITTDPTSDTEWTHPSGAYTVPAGQGTTVFGFASVDSREPKTGNLLDNIVFASGAAPNLAQDVAYTGDSVISVQTKTGYAYALAEVRGSTVNRLRERDVWFTATGGSEAAATVKAGLGDSASWYTPGDGTLVFKNLVPGKTYRLVGIPEEAISVDLGTNVSPGDVFDEGYYADTTIEAARGSLADGIGPNLSSSLYNAGTTAKPDYKGRITLSATDSRAEYALLTQNSSNAWVPARLGVAAADADWRPGTGAALTFDNLVPGTVYRVIARPAGYTELTWSEVAANTTSGVIEITVPAVGKEVTEANVARASDASTDQVTLTGLDADVTYHVLDAATGKLLWTGSGQTSYSVTLTDGDCDAACATAKTLQVVAELAGSYTEGVRVYPYPAFAKVTGSADHKELTIDYVSESIGVGSGSVPADIQFRIDYNGHNLVNTDAADGYRALTGGTRIWLGVPTAYTDQPILDAIETGEATLSYRLAPQASYDGAYITPVSTLVIPARPDISDVLNQVDWDAETIGGMTFTSFGYSGAVDTTLHVTTPAVAGEKFASKPVDFEVKKRPAAPA
ncbi:MAG: hypothetical protein LBR19_07720, partial [Bifidobacteriaceae bacterium]|nr:hypothetical protein [Bifidobacteriaceae bacterium]